MHSPPSTPLAAMQTPGVACCCGAMALARALAEARLTGQVSLPAWNAAAAAGFFEHCIADA